MLRENVCDFCMIDHRDHAFVSAISGSSQEVKETKEANGDGMDLTLLRRNKSKGGL